MSVNYRYDKADVTTFYDIIGYIYIYKLALGDISRPMYTDGEIINGIKLNINIFLTYSWKLYNNTNSHSQISKTNIIIKIIWVNIFYKNLYDTDDTTTKWNNWNETYNFCRYTDFKYVHIKLFNTNYEQTKKNHI